MSLFIRKAGCYMRNEIYITKHQSSWNGLKELGAEIEISKKKLFPCKASTKISTQSNYIKQ